MDKCLQNVQVKKIEQMTLIAERSKDAQIDEEDLEQVQEDLDKITGAAIYINECCSIMMNVYGQDCAAILSGRVKSYFAQVLSDRHASA